MSKINDGGSAFPVPLSHRLADGQPETAGGYISGADGMSLRAWLAGQALAGLMSDPQFQGDRDTAGIVCCRYADGVLKALAKAVRE